MANPWRRKKIESGPGGLDLIVRNLDTQKRGMVIVMSDFAKKWGAKTPSAPPPRVRRLLVCHTIYTVIKIRHTTIFLYIYRTHRRETAIFLRICQ